MRYYSYLNTAVKILNEYSGAQPFSIFIKSFFAADKKYGSKDRKQISHLCYCYFRLGHACRSLPVEERVIAGLFMCSSESHSLLEQIKPEWNESIALPVSQKLATINASEQDIFPWIDALSEGINAQVFIQSFFVQPDLFLRLRPGKKQIVEEKLKNAAIPYSFIEDNTIALPNASKLETIIALNKEAVVQDYSSQQVAAFFSFIKKNIESSIRIWDCCAASGGKSIVAKDIFNTIDLTVSDIRPSILHNLKKRFDEAGITSYKSFTADLSVSKEYVASSSFDLVICDAPCSGSGTWARTPEELYFFEAKQINTFRTLQKKIVANVVSAVKPGGFFLYITCSVFQHENEEVAGYCTSFGLQLVKKELIIGYDKKADTMFAALFKKPL